VTLLPALHHCTIAQPHHYTTTPVHRCPTAPRHHNTTTTLHQRTTAPQHHCAVAPPKTTLYCTTYHCTTATPNNRSTAPLHHCTLPHARLGWEADGESKLSAVVVHPAAVHQAQHVPHRLRPQHLPARRGTDPAVGCIHKGQRVQPFARSKLADMSSS
jgi:hypothetical protein